VWDETRVLEGEVGQYIVTARRKGSTWYVGGITNWDRREVEVDLKQLTGRASQVELYSDGVNADRKGSDYRHEVQSANRLKVHMAPGGGFVMKVQ
jgi:alpha-glucosidase